MFAVLLLSPSSVVQEKSDVNKLRNLLSDLKKVMDMYSGIIPDPEDDDDDVGGNVLHWFPNASCESA